MEGHDFMDRATKDALFLIMYSVHCKLKIYFNNLAGWASGKILEK
jgi:hypothetical protein